MRGCTWRWVGRVSARPELIRALGLWGAIAVNVANMIGTGVFLKTRVMTCNVGSPLEVLAVWLLAGLLCLAGTAAYSEIGALLPEAGGDYVFLRQAYGRAAAFLYGWTTFSVARTGSQAALAVGFAIFLNVAANGALAHPLWQFRILAHVFSITGISVVALLVIWVTAWMGCGRIDAGGSLTLALTVLKVALVAAVAIGAFVLGSGSLDHFRQSASAAASCEGVAATARGGLAGFSAAMLGALWAYDGWNNVAPLLGEMRQPERNIPRAFIGGTLLVVLLYLFVNAGYFYALTPEAMARLPASASVATETMKRFLGGAAVSVMAVTLMLSSFNALQSSVLANSRITYAMARDGLFFRMFGELSRRNHAPVRSILMQALWASVLALSGSFDALTDSVIFASWLFYGLSTGALFIFRRKWPQAARPYRIWGYPWVPGLFLAASVALLAGTFVSNPGEAVVGSLIMLAGLPLFAWFGRGQRPPPSAPVSATS